MSTFFVEPAQVQAEDQVTAPTTRQDAKAVRAWAISQGIEVGKRGRIRPGVFAMYDEAHRGA